jgi:hypothetical protein
MEPIKANTGHSDRADCNTKYFLHVEHWDIGFEPNQGIELCQRSFCLHYPVSVAALR